MKRQCVRCWLHLDKDQKLWCKKCKERVDEEFRGEVSRPYTYYFAFYLKKQRHYERKIREWMKDVC
jgi:hypothetical protein